MLVKQKLFFIQIGKKLTDVPLKMKLNGKRLLTLELSEIFWYKY